MYSNNRRLPWATSRELEPLPGAKQHKYSLSTNKEFANHWFAILLTSNLLCNVSLPGATSGSPEPLSGDRLVKQFFFHMIVFTLIFFYAC